MPFNDLTYTILSSYFLDKKKQKILGVTSQTDRHFIARMYKYKV